MTRRRFPVLDGAGSEVASVELFQEDGHWWIERSRFITSFRHIVDDGKVKALIRALENHQWAALDRVDGDFLPWYCRDCACNYAAELWSVSTLIDEEVETSGLDSHRGRCPQGHERTLAA